MTPTERVQRARALYREKLQRVLEPAEEGRFVAIDVATGEYALGDTSSDAVGAALARRPDAEICCLRVGKSWTYRVGARAWRRN